MELTARFQEDYAREKARRGVLDFSDLEHLALRLLTQDGDGGPGRWPGTGAAGSPR